MEIKEQEITHFLKAHHLGVFSTVNENGTPDAAPIYYTQDSHKNFLFVSPDKTQKAINIAHQDEVILTVVNEDTNITVEVRGKAHIDATRLKEAINGIAKKLETKNEVVDTLPLLKYKDQKKIAIIIEPITITYRSYNEKELVQKVLYF